MIPHPLLVFFFPGGDQACVELWEAEQKDMLPSRIWALNKCSQQRTIHMCSFSWVLLSCKSFAFWRQKKTLKIVRIVREFQNRSIWITRGWLLLWTMISFAYRNCMVKAQISNKCRNRAALLYNTARPESLQTHKFNLCFLQVQWFQLKCSTSLDQSEKAIKTFKAKKIAKKWKDLFSLLARAAINKPNVLFQTKSFIMATKTTWRIFFLLTAGAKKKKNRKKGEKSHISSPICLGSKNGNFQGNKNAKHEAIFSLFLFCADNFIYVMEPKHLPKRKKL